MTTNAFHSTEVTHQVTHTLFYLLMQSIVY
jgi:hypothetical protein